MDSEAFEVLRYVIQDFGRSGFGVFVDNEYRVLRPVVSIPGIPCLEFFIPVYKVTKHQLILVLLTDRAI